MQVLIFVALCLTAVYGQLGQQELNEICQKECNEYVCLLNYPRSCRKRIVCLMIGETRAFEKECAKGTFFDTDLRTCVHSEHSNCQYDKCKEPNTLSYKDESDNHCKYHWICTEDGKSQRACCQSGYAYVEGQGCVEDATCDDHCESDTFCVGPEKGPNCRMYWNCTDTNTFKSICCPPGQSYNSTLEQCEDNQYCISDCPSDICTFTAVQGDKYRFMDGGVYKRCSPGTMFDQDKCQCIFDPDYVPECKPTAEIDFMGEEQREALAYVTYQPESLANGSGIGYFDGNSHLEVPYFLYGNDLDKIYIHMEFKTENAGPNRQILASNCKTENTNLPSLQAMLIKDLGIILVSVFSNEQKFFEVNYEPNQWNDFELEFNGSELKVKVVPETPNVLKSYEEEITLSGKLRKSTMPLNFGVCSNSVDRQGQTTDTHFHGEMRNINIYTGCIPAVTAPVVA